MFYVYVIKSTKDSDIYIGSTNNLKRRLNEHNSLHVRSTKSRAPFELKYYEAYSDESDARQREQRLKLDGRAKQALVKRIENTLTTLQNYGIVH